MPQDWLLDQLMLALRVLMLGGQAVLVFRLYQLRLHSRYRIFFAYLIFITLRTAVLFPLDVRGTTYAWIWLSTGPVLWVFYALLVLEVYSLVLGAHKGLYTLGRWVLTAAMAAALVFSVFTLALPASATQRGLLINQSLLAQRGIYISLVIFLFIILLFLARYPVPLSRNVIVHSLVFTAYFLSHSLALLFRTVLGYDVGRMVNVILAGISATCMVAWLGLLSRKGEEQRVVWRRGWRPEQERRLVEQLNAMNRTLLRAARK